MGLLTDQELTDSLDRLKAANASGNEEEANNVLAYLSVRFREVFCLKGGRIVRSTSTGSDVDEYLQTSQRG